MAKENGPGVPIQTQIFYKVCDFEPVNLASLDFSVLYLTTAKWGSSGVFFTRLFDLKEERWPMWSTGSMPGTQQVPNKCQSFWPWQAGPFWPVFQKTHGLSFLGPSSEPWTALRSPSPSEYQTMGCLKGSIQGIQPKHWSKEKHLNGFVPKSSMVPTPQRRQTFGTLESGCLHSMAVFVHKGLSHLQILFRSYCLFTQPQSPSLLSNFFANIAFKTVILFCPFLSPWHTSPLPTFLSHIFPINNYDYKNPFRKKSLLRGYY